MLAMQRLEKNVNFPQTVVPTKSAVCKRRVLEHCAEYSGEVKATCVSRELAAHRDFGIGVSKLQLWNWKFEVPWGWGIYS